MLANHDGDRQQREFEILVRDMNEITTNISSYVDYCEKREGLLKNILQPPSSN